MLERLIQLYSKHGNASRTPLEDFTTEAFVGLLEANGNLRSSFLSDFLDLEDDEYFIKTQKKYVLNDDIDCIIDIVIEGSYPPVCVPTNWNPDTLPCKLACEDTIAVRLTKKSLKK